jgi:hypothetical protein
VGIIQAGIMSEMVEDAIDTLDEDEEELEEEADAEVQNVLFNITDGKLGQMGSVGSKLPHVCRSSSQHTYFFFFFPRPSDASFFFYSIHHFRQPRSLNLRKKTTSKTSKGCKHS